MENTVAVIQGWRFGDGSRLRNKQGKDACKCACSRMLSLWPHFDCMVMALARKRKVSWPSLVRWLQAKGLEPEEAMEIMKTADAEFKLWCDAHKDLFEFHQNYRNSRDDHPAAGGKRG